MKVYTQEERAGRLLTWIQRRGGTATTREVVHAQVGGIKTAAAAIAALQDLARRGRGRAFETTVFGKRRVEFEAEEVPQEDAVGNLTRAELFAEWTAERERRTDGAVAFGEAAAAMVNAEHLRHRRVVTDLAASRDQAIRERDEAREQSALYRRSLGMLAADDARAEQEAQP